MFTTNASPLKTNYIRLQKLFVLFLIPLICSCTGKDTPQARKSAAYFDLTNYFNQEVTRLNKSRPLILKSVEVDAIPEKKQVRIEDWGKEFNMFQAADINKKAWEGAFKIEKTADSEIYTTDNEKISVKKLLINKRGGVIFHISIIAQTKNMIYTSYDTLNYYPDSLYSIHKTQKIKLLPEKRYRIEGYFLPASH